MDLCDRLIEHEHWHTARLLEQAGTLADELLDKPVRPGLIVHDFEGPEPDVRTMPQFNALVRRIRDRNEWDDVFVDALCTPPVSFTFGSVVAHIVTASMMRRQTIVGVLRELGVRDVEARDPIEWERMIAARA